MNPTIHGAAARLALALGIVACTATAAVTQDSTILIERPVSYSSDQADRGQDRYKKECEECHGDDLRGGLNGGPPLRGLAFEEKYFSNLPASVMFAFMSTAMPPNSPGRFSPDIYADLMAYILKLNGVRAGEPLPSDLEALDTLVMSK